MTGDYNASFVGFAPANDPVLSMIVVMERPRNDIYGGAVAAPVFQESHVLRAAPLQHSLQRHQPEAAQGRGGHLLGRDLMQLGDILDDVTLDVATSGLEIDHVEIDSRVCVPGSLFFAMPGTKQTESPTPRDAVALGAVCVVGDVAVHSTRRSSSCRRRS